MKAIFTIIFSLFFFTFTFNLAAAPDVEAESEVYVIVEIESYKLVYDGLMMPPNAKVIKRWEGVSKEIPFSVARQLIDVYRFHQDVSSDEDFFYMMPYNEQVEVDKGWFIYDYRHYYDHAMIDETGTIDYRLKNLHKIGHGPNWWVLLYSSPLLLVMLPWGKWRERWRKRVESRMMECPPGG